MTVLDFANSGDVLAFHDHEPGEWHYTIVARGTVRIFGDDWEKLLLAGSIYRFKEGEPHGIEAMSDEARVVNVRHGEGEIYGPAALWPDGFVL